MQATRQRILEILKERGEATVEELSQALGLTSVTVRHHLEILQGRGLVEAPTVRRRRAPGRPQYVYTLTEAASEHFPKDYQRLASLMIAQIRDHLSSEELHALMEGMADGIAADAPAPSPDAPLSERLKAVAEFLTDRGYIAHWEEGDNGSYYLYTHNCPYHRVAREHPEVCAMDEALLTRLLGISPTQLTWVVRGDDRCTYRITPSASPLS